MWYELVYINYYDHHLVLLQIKLLEMKTKQEEVHLWGFYLYSYKSQWQQHISLTSVFSSVPDADPTLGLEHHLHPGQQISHTDEDDEFPTRKKLKGKWLSSGSWEEDALKQ